MPTKRMPQWMAKYPCENCGSGYGQCRSFAPAGLQCCADCQHPGHRLAQPHPWTADELEEMWHGREMPVYIADEVRKLRAG